MEWVLNKKTKIIRTFIIVSNLNDKAFQKTSKFIFIIPFSTDMDPDFCIFLATCRKSKKKRKKKKKLIQISGERRAER